MMRVIEQTRDEKIAMYMKLTKRELIEMLVNCNELIAKFGPGAPQWVQIAPDVTAATVAICPPPTIRSNQQ